MCRAAIVALMQTAAIALLAAQDLPAVADGQVPDWVHLLPGGALVETGDARGPYHVNDLAAIIAASPGKLPIDENHAIDIAGPRGEPSPARGHIVELQARDDGLWGRVEWGATGRALMTERAYLGISPVITHDADKSIRSVLRASLTNRPNLRGLTALHQENSMSHAAIAKALGLGDDATEASILTAIGKVTETKSDTTALQSSLTEIGVALGVAEGAKPEAVLAAAKLAAASGDTVIPALQAQVTTLSETVKTLTEGSARKAAEAFVDGAKADRRIGITQANRDRFVALHMADPVETEKLINGFPKMPEGSALTEALQHGGETVSLQSDSRDLVGKARAYQASQKAAGHDVNWTDAVMAVSEGKK